MADLKTKYGTKADFAITLGSLSDNSARESDVVNNDSDLFVDYQIGGFIKSASSGVGTNGHLTLKLYGSVDGGTTYTSDATGSDSAHTLDGNEIHLKTVEFDQTSKTFKVGPFNVAQAFGGTIPSKWGVIVENQSDASLDGTEANHELHYKGVLYQSA